jgi:hypothetical protein
MSIFSLTEIYLIFNTDTIFLFIYPQYYRTIYQSFVILYGINQHV